MLPLRVAGSCARSGEGVLEPVFDGNLFSLDITCVCGSLVARLLVWIGSRGAFLGGFLIARKQAAGSKFRPTMHFPYLLSRDPDVFTPRQSNAIGSRPRRLRFVQPACNLIVCLPWYADGMPLMVKQNRMDTLRRQNPLFWHLVRPKQGT